MKRRNGRRGAQLHLNFDGLTDSVTNLVGALILLVLLVIGVTEEAVSQEEMPAPPTAAGEDQTPGDFSVAPLTDRVTFLKTQIQSVNSEIDAMDASLDTVRTEIEELIEQVDDIKVPEQIEEEPEPEEVEQPMEVRFRPPQFRDEPDVNTDFFVVCENGRVSLFRFPEYIAARDRAFEEGGGTVPDGTLIQVNESDFDMRVADVGPALAIVEGMLTTVTVAKQRDLVRKRDHPGESIPEIRQNASEYNRLLREEEETGSQQLIQFAVFPDSFDAFREARELAWERGFRLNWMPVPTGETISFGRGSVGSQ